MKLKLTHALGLVLLLGGAAQGGQAADDSSPRLIARTCNSGFPQAHDTYNAMGTGSDGKIYYVLSSENIDQGAKMFCFDPKTEQIKELGDLTEACGEKGSKAIPQGKSHVNFIEVNGKLYFATHVGVYSIIEGKECMGVPPAGYKRYPGGHMLSYDLKTGAFEDFGICPDREGVITFNMDKQRGRLFGITWPSGIFYRYDLATKNQKSFGKMCAKGEDGVGAEYRTVCLLYFLKGDHPPVVQTLAHALYWILPRLDRFTVADQIVYGALPDPSYLAILGAYAVAYAGILLLLSIGLFSRREFV